MSRTTSLFLVAIAMQSVGSCGGNDGTAIYAELSGMGGAPNSGNPGGTSNAGMVGTAQASGATTSVGGSGGYSSGIAGGSGVNPRWNDTATQGCTLWPTGRLMPRTGLFFYGPDPGPCRSGGVNGFLDTTVYTYDANGRVQTYGNFGRPIRYKYEGDLIVNFTYGGSDLTDGIIGYQIGGIEVRRANNTARFELDPLGYPRRVTYDENLDGTADWGRLYHYENCRLIKVTVDPDLPQPPATSTISNDDFEYDAEGHISTIRSGNGSVETYDYACWKQ